MPPSRCPANADLHDGTALDEMLRARASPRAELVIMLLGWTNGKTQITMRESGAYFLRSQVASLEAHGVPYHLTITPHFEGLSARRGTDNLCLNALRPKGICCGYSNVGFRELQSIDPTQSGNNTWRMFATHPYLLFLQRWWFTAEALVRGYSILSLDTDVHFSTNPLELVRGTPWLARFDVAFQGDGGWPVRLRHRGNVAPAHRGSAKLAAQHKDGDEVGVACPRHGAHAAASSSGCTCGVTAAPALNTGFVWARSGPRAEATAHLFNRTVRTILKRLLLPSAITDARGAVHIAALWPQAVMNEMAFELARPPAITAADGGGEGGKGGGEGGDGARCHPLDPDCVPWAAPKVADAFGVLMPRTWWVKAPRSASVWRASEQRGPAGRSCGGGGGGAAGELRADGADEARGGVDVALKRPWHDHLIAHAELAGGVRLAVVPRTLVGRVCGRRKLPLSSLDGRDAAPQPLPCSALRRPTLLGMSAQHSQFMNIFTRMRIYDALEWWDRAEGPPPRRGAGGSVDVAPAAASRADAVGDAGAGCGLTAAELARRLPPAVQREALTLIGSAVANVSLLCATLPRSVAHEVSTRCPCCWLAPPAIAKETTGCPAWNPNL